MTRSLHLLLVATIMCPTITAAQAQSSGGEQKIDFGKGNSVPFTAIRTEAVAPVPTYNEDAFRLRLKNGGTVAFSQSDVVIGEPNFQQRSLQFMALDTLKLLKGARIVTGGNDLVIIANKIVSEDGYIVAFTDKTRRAKDGVGTGAPGAPGVSGGTVTLIALDGIEGRLHIDLSGQVGGDGQQGAVGSTGTTGLKGDQPVWTLINCNKDGGNGSPGGNGGKGGAGGAAGNGGHGGTFLLYNVGPTPIPSAYYDFVANAGQPGTPGPGGPGGEGGLGGVGGDGGGPCHSGQQGQPGNQGPTGDTGSAGVSGSPGTTLVTNMDFELTLKTTKQLPLNQGNP